MMERNYVFLLMSFKKHYILSSLIENEAGIYTAVPGCGGSIIVPSSKFFLFQEGPSIVPRNIFLF